MVTATDEVNMVACQVADALFNVTTKVARVRNQCYLQPIWSNLFSPDHLPIDVIISPEIEVARAIARRLQDPLAELVKIEPKAIGVDRKSTRLNSSHIPLSRMPSSA